MTNNDLNINNLISELSVAIAKEESEMHTGSLASPDIVAAELLDAWDLSSSYLDSQQFDHQSAFNSFQSKVGIEGHSIEAESIAASTSLSAFFQKTASKVVTTIAIAALISGFWLLSPEKYTALANESEKIKTFALQDGSGSMMTMFPGSLLKIFSDSSNDNLKIDLEGGQVYADIKESKNPVQVDLAGNELLVSETVFAAETHDNVITINVYEGNGSYHCNDKVYTLTTETKMVHNLATGEILVSPGADNSIVDFTRGSISFIDTPLNEVFDRLGSFYNVDFQYDLSKAKGKNFTSAVLDNQNLESIVETIEISFNLEAVKTDTKIYSVSFK